MYDTVKLWVPNLKPISEYKYLENTLANLTKHTKYEYSYLTGKLKNLTINVYNSGLSMQGSIAKYYLGSNILTMTREDTKLALETLSEHLKIDVNEGLIRRLDFGSNLIMNHPPKAYYPFLGEYGRFKRFIIKNTLYYQTGSRTLCFYDKTKETKKNRDHVPIPFQNKNILRFEVRLMNRLPSRFNTTKLTAKVLFQEPFFSKIKDSLLEEYYSICKVTTCNINFKKMNKPSDFEQYLAALKIKELGLENTYGLLEQLKSEKCFKHKEYYSRTKARILKILKEHESSEPERILDELNEKIEKFGLMMVNQL